MTYWIGQLGASCWKVLMLETLNSRTLLYNSLVLAEYYLNYPVKVAEHSFRAHFCWCNSARAQGLQKTNMPSIERSFYLLNTRSICAIFLYNW